MGMNWVGAIALYFVVWWITLFAMLPIGVRSQHEGGDVSEGTDPGAPIAPMLGRKLVYTTLAAVPLAAFLWYFVGYSWSL
jgi:predicted secreted protein